MRENMAKKQKGQTIVNEPAFLTPNKKDVFPVNN